MDAGDGIEVELIAHIPPKSNILLDGPYALDKPLFELTIINMVAFQFQITAFEIVDSFVVGPST